MDSNPSYLNPRYRTIGYLDQAQEEVPVCGWLAEMLLFASVPGVSYAEPCRVSGAAAVSARRKRAGKVLIEPCTSSLRCDNAASESGGRTGRCTTHQLGTWHRTSLLLTGN